MEADALGIKPLQVVTDGSTDKKLIFKMQLTKAVPNNTTIHFQVTKRDKSGKALPSAQFAFPINYVAN